MSINKDIDIRRFKFPRTPHLPSSHVSDNDRTMSISECVHLCENSEIIICEGKIDGTNVGVYFAEESQPILLKSAGLITNNEKKQYNVYRNWVFKHMDILWRVLGTRWVLFGEWLWQTHSIEYNQLPDYLIGFDLYDRSTESFVCSNIVRKVIGNNIAVVPILWKGCIYSAENLIEHVKEMVGDSAYGQTKVEGVYIRFEANNNLIARAKYRRADFIPGSDLLGKRNSLK